MSDLSNSEYRVSPETFKTLLKQRKEERKENAEQLYQLNQQRIYDMKSKVGINPLERFPKEIWKIILEYLSPADKGNMCRIHDVFQGLMNNSQIGEILFPQVICETGIVSSYEFEESLKQLRGVSKSFRNAVDRYYENNLLSIIRLENKDTNRYPPKFTFAFLTYQNARNVIEQLTSGPETERPKRFFCRSLSVSLSPYVSDYSDEETGMDQLFLQFNKNITTFIELVGDQIWHFHFDLRDIEEFYDAIGVTVPQIYATLQKWLIQMPNLKWLEIAIQSSGWEIMKTDTSLSMIELMKKQPFPKLNELERLDFSLETSNGDAIQICESVLRINQHVNILGLSGFQHHWKRIPLSAVQSLNLKSICVGENGCFSLHFLKPLVNLRWLLKMNLRTVRSCDSMSSVLNFINNFPTLEQLELEFSSEKIGDNLTFLRLPNIKHFKLKMPKVTQREWNQNLHFLFSLQFLLYCKKLKYIEWNSVCDNLEKFRCDIKKFMCPEATIEFQGGWADLSNSNIWNIFPHLEDVQLDLHNRSRGQSKLYKKKYCRGGLVNLNVIDLAFRPLR